MSIRIIALTRIMLFSALVVFSTVSLATENPDAGEIPGLDRIMSDASRHFVYTDEGLPVIRHLATAPRVHDATINSSVRGDGLLTLNVSLFLSDLNSSGDKNTLAKSRMTYRETDGVWELQTVEQSSIEQVRSLTLTSEDDC